MIAFQFNNIKTKTYFLHVSDKLNYILLLYYTIYLMKYKSVK